MAGRSRFPNRPMSPYESALLDAVSVIFPALIRLGTDPEELRRELRDYADVAQEGGPVHRAEILRFMAQYSIPARTLGSNTNGEQPRD
jgi:hypothetical protein